MLSPSNQLINIVSLSILSFCLSAQPEIEWQKTYGDFGFDNAIEILHTIDDGFIIGSNITIGDPDDPYNAILDNQITKFDIEGNIEWQKTYGGTSNDIIYAMANTSDGGFIYGGATSSIDGDIVDNKGFFDLWIFKTDNQGELEWSNTFGGSGGDFAWSVLQSEDGGYIVAGTSDSTDGDLSQNNGTTDIWIMKIDALGNLLWEQTMGGVSDEKVKKVIQSSDGGFIFAGTSSFGGDISNSQGLFDYWIIKLDVDGNLVWENTYGGTEPDFATSIAETESGGFVVAGQTYSNNGMVSQNFGESDIWVIEIDKDGNLIWEQNFGGSSDEAPSSIIKGKSGGYLISGYTVSNDEDISLNKGSADIWLLKISDQGQLEWEKTIGGSETDFATSIIQLESSAIIIAGESGSSDGDFVVNNGGADIMLVKFDALELNTNDLVFGNNFIVGPNPTSGHTKVFQTEYMKGVEFKMFDSNGKLVLYKDNIPQILDLKSILSGVYILQFNLGESIATKKLIVNN